MRERQIRTIEAYITALLSSSEHFFVIVELDDWPWPAIRYTFAFRTIFDCSFLAVTVRCVLKLSFLLNLISEAYVTYFTLIFFFFICVLLSTRDIVNFYEEKPNASFFKFRASQTNWFALDINALTSIRRMLMKFSMTTKKKKKRRQKFVFPQHCLTLYINTIDDRHGIFFRNRESHRKTSAIGWPWLIQ